MLNHAIMFCCTRGLAALFCFGKQSICKSWSHMPPQADPLNGNKHTLILFLWDFRQFHINSWFHFASTILSEWGICPYGIWYPWVHGGRGLDALGKFFRRRRRRPPGFGKWPLLELYYGIGGSGVRGSIRLGFRSTDARILRKVVVGRNQIFKKSWKKWKMAKKDIPIQFSVFLRNPFSRSGWPVWGSGRGENLRVIYIGFSFGLAGPYRLKYICCSGVSTNISRPVWFVQPV